MQKLLIASILQQIALEIQIICYKTDKEYLEKSDILALYDEDLKHIRESKFLKNFLRNYNNLDYPFLKMEFPSRVLELIIQGTYDREDLIELFDIINPYIKYYLETLKTYEVDVESVVTLKYHMKGYEGKYPIFLKLEENLLSVDKVYFGSNAYGLICGSESKFGFVVNYVGYSMPIKEYKYKGQDLREKSFDEIYEMLSSSIKANMKFSYAYASNILEVDLINNKKKEYSEAELSLLLEEKKVTQKSFKEIFKDSLKKSIFMFSILIIVIIALIVYRYVIKK